MNLLDLYVRVAAKDEASSEIDQISGNIIGKLGSAASTAAKALGALWAGSKVVEFGKQAFDAYSQFEQLEGGVAKLYGNAGMTLEQYAQSVGQTVDQVQGDYERNARAQELMMSNAQQAWKTAGMDANSYMEQATSFSAALINSLGGDTEEAAKLTDEAMSAMSDNANTFGSDMSSIQNAFQGFAKQNYTMLDNLKLGYGGTKTEMERLIADAAAMTKEQEDLNMTVDAGSTSFDNIVKAIQVVQKHQGIYGTTSREALNTIEGSMNATKSAWTNLVAEIGKPDADIGARIGDMLTAIMGENGEGGVLRNVTGEIQTIVGNVTNAISNGLTQGFDWLVTNGPQAASDAMQSVAGAITNAASSLGNLGSLDLSAMLFGDGENQGLVDRVSSFVQNLGTTIQENWPLISEALGQLWSQIVTLVQENGPQLLETAGQVLGNIGNAILTHGPELVGAAAEALYSFMEWATSHGPEIVSTIAGIIGTVVETAKNWLLENGPSILEAVGQTISNVAQAVMDHGPEILGNIATTIGTIIGYIGNAATEMIPAAIRFMGGLITGTSQEGEKLHAWFAGLPQRLLDALGDVGSFLVDAGSNIINGFWNGLKSKWDEVTGWVSGIGDWIAEHKGPKSYDLGLLVDNGKWIMQSLQTGLEKGLPPVEDTLRDITDSIQTGINTNVGVTAVQAPNRDAAILNALGAIRDNMNMSVYLDGNTLVGGIAPTMDTALGRL